MTSAFKKLLCQALNVWACSSKWPKIIIPLQRNFLLHPFSCFFSESPFPAFSKNNRRLLKKRAACGLLAVYITAFCGYCLVFKKLTRQLSSSFWYLIFKNFSRPVFFLSLSYACIIAYYYRFVKRAWLKSLFFCFASFLKRFFTACQFLVLPIPCFFVFFLYS